ncbi:MAG: peptidoglycan-binding protein [Rhodospirillaceae bacterium]|nr:peptidoglycan-binding protein [Rhodospirillaceae bacterium]
MADDQDPKKTTTLQDGDIQSRSALPRRSLLRLVGHGAVGATALVGASREAYAITDNDSGPCADPVNAGRGYSGITDNDTGTCADPGGRGRGGGGYTPGYTGITDSDSGAYADAAGYGRGRVVRVNQLVLSIQTNLANLGFNPGPIDGVFGQRTQAAIIAFQRTYGYPVTGAADQVTMAQLQQVR